MVLTYGEIVLTFIAVMVSALPGVLVVYLHGMNEKLSNLLNVIETSFAETKRLIETSFAKTNGMIERIFDKISQDKHTAIDPEFKLKQLNTIVDIEIGDISEKSAILKKNFNLFYL